MPKINFEGLKSNLLDGDTSITSYTTVMFSVSGNNTKEIFDAANLHAAENGLHNISARSMQNNRTDWEQIFGKADPEHPFLDDQEPENADDQEGREDQTRDEEDLRQQEEG